MRMLSRSLGYSGTGQMEVADEAASLSKGLITLSEADWLPEELFCCVKAEFCERLQTSTGAAMSWNDTRERSPACLDGRFAEIVMLRGKRWSCVNTRCTGTFFVPEIFKSPSLNLSEYEIVQISDNE